MSDKKFFWGFISILTVIFAVFMGLNYEYDFYGIFNYNAPVLYGSVNDRYIKPAYLSEHPQKYDAYLFGTSRVKKIDTSLWPGRVYNMGADACADPREWLRDLQTLLANNVQVKTVYLGMDDNVYKKDSAKYLIGIRWTPYKSSWENLAYKGKVLLQIPDFKDMKPEKRRQDSKTEIGKNGTLVIPANVEAGIENDPAKHVNDKKFLVPKYESDDAADIEAAVGALQKIKRLCEQRQIRLVMFFNPLHATTYLKDDIALLHRFKKEVAEKVGGYYDFCDLNFINVNNYYWYETSHPRAFTGRYIMNRLTGSDLDKTPADFGKYVDKNNVEAYLQEKLREREAYLNGTHEQYLPRPGDKFVYPGAA